MNLERFKNSRTRNNDSVDTCHSDFERFDFCKSMILPRRCLLFFFLFTQIIIKIRFRFISHYFYFYSLKEIDLLPRAFLKKKNFMIQIFISFLSKLLVLFDSKISFICIFSSSFKVYTTLSKL